MRAPWKVGDRVWCAGEEAEVLEILPLEDSYRVKLLTTEREITIDERLVWKVPKPK